MSNELTKLGLSGARVRRHIAGAVLAVTLAHLGCSRGVSRSSETTASASASSSAAAPPLPVPLTPDAAIDAWNDANNRHDLDALRLVYASQVDFYGQHLSSDDVVAAKARAFKKGPDFRQELSDKTTTRTRDTVLASFTKTWTSSGLKRHVKASIELRLMNGRFLVTKETDASVAGMGDAGSGAGTMSVAQAAARCSANDSDLYEFEVWTACAALAERYESGDGVPKDLVRATQLAKRVCDTGVTGMRSPFGRDFCYGFSGRNGIKPPLGCCYEGPHGGD